MADIGAIMKDISTTSQRLASMDSVQAKALAEAKQLVGTYLGWRTPPTALDLLRAGRLDSVFDIARQRGAARLPRME